MEKVLALTDPISRIKGFGPQKCKAFEKLNVHTVGDALQMMPRTAEDWTEITKIADIQEEGIYTIRAKLCRPSSGSTSRGLIMVRSEASDATGRMVVTWFNNPYIAHRIHGGSEYLLHGRVSQFMGKWNMTAPQMEEIMPGHPMPRKVVPIYPLSSPLKQWDLKKVLDAAFDLLPKRINDPLPKELRERRDMPGLRDAMLMLHRPNSVGELEAASARMSFEQLFLFNCKLLMLKQARANEEGIQFHADHLSEFMDALPFELTGAQKRTILEIAQDCSTGKPMNRLVQGDVGSGKTAVAAVACALAIQNGYQAAFMAPTEILAEQHAKTLTKMFAPFGVNVACLTSAMPAKEKREVLARISSGEAQLAVGTHALIQKGVTYHKLGLVVADEQHRFGVSQRAALSGKGSNVHMLVMSATPIPRTMALIVYGDLDVSFLDELPPGRTPIQTYAITNKDRKRLYSFMDQQVQAGNQVYVVCPTIEEGVRGLKSAEQHSKDIQEALPQHRVVCLHGRMKGEEKDKIMQDFKARKYDILVSTTVIEVGIDVPNATLMLVEDAQQFGLAQLHQLRGRVGRGEKKSYCVLVSGVGDTELLRLKVMCQTTDGFEIAQADLKHRGPGEVLGNRQHGSPFENLAPGTGMKLLMDARKEAEIILAKDPKLMHYAALRKRLKEIDADLNAFN
ncbi:ATP-dependent DNA helicase RecG [Agathobaculum desmolans]|uniref:ATP-dependent DNA helicase RecG n=1 Tax=Agathobaculum desmolans TaxID=39484 RepID=UPI00248E6E44|nr:ATP-dependent DNA helicase RecG [Agathobaculum desmolans]